MKIVNLQAREVLNTIGQAAIDCEVTLSDGSITSSSISLDKTEKQKTLDIINNLIAKEFIGKEPHAVEMDVAMAQMDGTTNKSNFGKNTILAVSTAIFKAHAIYYEMELFDFISMVSGLETISFPIPIVSFVNSINKHSDYAIKEYMVVPFGSTGIRNAIDISIFLFNKLKEDLQKNKTPFSIGDHGDIVYNFADCQDPIQLIKKIQNELNFSSDTFGIGIDVDASSLYDSQNNIYKVGSSSKNSDDLIAFYKQLHEKYNLFLIQDGLDLNDWQGWIKLMNEFSGNMHIVANKLFSTNSELIFKGINLEAANTVAINPYQIGTITETLQAIALCKENGLSTIITNNKNETNDSFIVDLAIGANCNYIKCGGLNRGEHIAKYNRFLEIEKSLADFIG